MVRYSPLMPEVLEDPLPIYKQLRDEAPAYYVEEFDCWALSRFEDIWEQSGDNESYSAAQRGTTPSHLITKQQDVFPSVNMMDPPEHVRNRALISGAFKPRRVAGLAPAVEEIVARHSAKFETGEEFDLVDDFIGKVAMEVSCILLGVPVEDAEEVYAYVNRFFARDEGKAGMTADGLQAAADLNTYLEGLIALRRRQPTEDDVLLNAYLNARFDGKPLPDDNIASQMATLVIGSTDSFPKIFAGFALELFRNPDQRAELVANPDLIPNAFREGLRYGMPTQFLGRTVTKPVELHGNTFEPGQAVIFLFPSANRDEREFENPDVFDIHRESKRILTFGHGNHSCLGTHIAALEGEIATRHLLAKMPEFEVDTSRIKRLKSEFVAGVIGLPVRRG
ncbi:MAG: cytochrome P450 [Myxococcota bacterium]